MDLTAVRIRTAAIVYGLFAAAAIGWGFLRENPDIFHHPDGVLSGHLPLVANVILGAAVGIAFGMCIAWLTRFTVYKFRWARALHIEFRGLLGPLRDSDILVYAVLTAVGEEMLFRGAMQPELGIVTTSVIFGLAHIAWGRKSIPWPMQAIAMGFAFGGLYWLTGNLTAPVLAHFTINYQNLHFINRYDPSLQLPKTFATNSPT